MAPMDVNINNSKAVFKNLYGKSSLMEVYTAENKQSPKLKESDEVRMVHKHKPFDKGFYPNWTDQLYKVKTVDACTEHPVYKLEDLSGKELKEKKFYDKELQKVNTAIHRIEKIIKRRTVRGKTQYLVKWIGYNSEYNSWINSEDLTELA